MTFQYHCSTTSHAIDTIRINLFIQISSCQNRNKNKSSRVEGKRKVKKEKYLTKFPVTLSLLQTLILYSFPAAGLSLSYPQHTPTEKNK
jgi:hypothetical protein